MRLVIVVQSEEFLTSAGVRIRYQRFAEHLPEGVSMSFAFVDQLLANRDFSADSYLFVKTFTDSGLLLLAHLSAAGRYVGHDLFDDYFSQFDDAQLRYFRAWLTAAAPFSHYFISTTQQLRSVAERYMPHAMAHIVPDPCEAFDVTALARQLTAKLERMRNTRQLRLLWFGIGDNPFFPVGIQDLVKHAAVFERMHRLGWQTGLTVLTNRRALTSGSLASLKRLPVRIEIEEWSVERERQALEEADIALLPVADQSFSRAKSLNRCLTALTGGCQVLSLGFPLYAELDNMIYRDTDSLLGDIAAGRPRLSPHDMHGLMEAIAIADPAAIAESFFLASTIRPDHFGPGTEEHALCVLHGADSSTQNHKTAQALKHLSVRSPFHKADINYDVRFDIDDDARFLVHVEQTLLPELNPGLPIQSGAPHRFGGRMYVRIEGEAVGLGRALVPHSARSGRTASRLVAYTPVMAAVALALRQMFPHRLVVVSERSRIMPWPHALLAMA